MTEEATSPSVRFVRTWDDSAAALVRRAVPDWSVQSERSGALRTWIEASNQAQRRFYEELMPSSVHVVLVAMSGHSGAGVFGTLMRPLRPSLVIFLEPMRRSFRCTMTGWLTDLSRRNPLLKAQDSVADRRRDDVLPRCAARAGGALSSRRNLVRLVGWLLSSLSEGWSVAAYRGAQLRRTHPLRGSTGAVRACWRSSTSTFGWKATESARSTMLKSCDDGAWSSRSTKRMSYAFWSCRRRRAWFRAISRLAGHAAGERSCGPSVLSRFRPIACSYATMRRMQASVARCSDDAGSEIGLAIDANIDGGIGFFDLFSIDADSRWNRNRMGIGMESERARSWCCSCQPGLSLRRSAHRQW